VPTQDPFLYTLSVTATEGTSLEVVEETALAQLDAVRRHGVTEREVQKAKNQLRARMVFEGDCISNIAHQLGYFETIASWRLVPSLAARIDAVTVQQVGDAASTRLKSANRTIGWFDPQPPSDEDVSSAEGASSGPVSGCTR
jgi:predicted Zn-dependent peptidase